MTTLAGTPRKKGLVDASGALARFYSPSGLTYAPDTNKLYVADTGNSVLRSVTFDSEGMQQSPR